MADRDVIVQRLQVLLSKDVLADRWCETIEDAIELLEEQQNLIKEYEKLSQACFKIEKSLKIADLSILIDRIEEGKVEVLQDDGRPGSMETTIKIRRL